MKPLEIKLKTLTPIWTSGIDSKECDRLHETGIIGSLRWWYEALIRRLGGKACDPTDSKCDGEDHCAACELFGCTGWSRKFKLQIIDVNGILVDNIKINKEYIFKFIFLREVYTEEKFLLYTTIKIISDIGSIGGKTVLKPSEKPEKNKKPHHLDYGLIELNSDYTGSIFTKKQIENFLNKFKNVPHKDDFPDLRNFWYVRNYYIPRDKINSIVSRNDKNSKYYKNNASELQKWIGGKVGVSKKIFSFHSDVARRTWGYTPKGKLEMVIELLEKENIQNIQRGNILLNQIFKKG